MFCPHCGRKIAEDSAYCSFCGKAVSKLNNTLCNSGAAPYAENPQIYAPKPAPKAKNNGFSIAGFVLSLVSLISSFIYVLSDSGPHCASVVWQLIGGSFILCFIEAILGLTFSIIGTVKSKQIGKGKGLGIAGVVLSAIMFALWLAICFVLFLFLISLSFW